jgi:hypothetical protein
MPEPVALRFDTPAFHVPIPPGGELVLRGSLYSSHDGSRVDATTTTWPADAPGGGSIDPGGMYDLEAGGFHLASQDPQAHVVHAVATGVEAPACSLHGVSSPCLLSRLAVQANSRLMQADDWYGSLHGSLAMEVAEPPFYAPALPWTAALWPVARVAGVLFAIALLVALGVWIHKVRASTPTAVLARLARRVRTKAERAAPLLAAPLQPALDSASRALRSRSLDPRSPQGRRVSQLLAGLEERLDATAREQTAASEKQLADNFALEVEIALQAAAEAARTRS